MPSEKTFTQDEVNTLLARERRKSEERIAELERSIADYERLKTTLTERATELQSEATTATAKARALETQLAQTTERNARERAELEARHAETTSVSRETGFRLQLTQALLAADVFPGAVRVAADELRRQVKLEHDAGGAIASVEYGGTRHTDPVAAARAFLSAHPYFARGAPGGSGTPRPGGGSGHGGLSTPLEYRNPSELLNEGMREAPR